MELMNVPSGAAKENATASQARGADRVSHLPKGQAAEEIDLLVRIGDRVLVGFLAPSSRASASTICASLKGRRSGPAEGRLGGRRAGIAAQPCRRQRRPGKDSSGRGQPEQRRRS